MSQFVVDLSGSGSEEKPAVKEIKTTLNNDAKPPKKSGGLATFLKISAVVLVVLFFLGLIAGYFYWQSVKASPAYSLALLVDAARRDDQKMIDELIDIDAVVDNFLPQVIDKANEMYGKNVPQVILSNLSLVTDQFKPAIKKRAREEVPRVIREKTDKFESIPFWAVALGAGWVLDIKQTGETATVISKIPDRPFELTMKRNGDVWRITAIKDEALAKRIAEKIGQEMMAIIQKEGMKKASEKLGVKNAEDLKEKLEGIFK